MLKETDACSLTAAKQVLGKGFNYYALLGKKGIERITELTLRSGKKSLPLPSIAPQLLYAGDPLQLRDRLFPSPIRFKIDEKDISADPLLRWARLDTCQIDPSPRKDPQNPV